MRQGENEMETDHPAWVVTSGLDIIGSDGEKLGEVQETTETAFIVKPGWLVPDAPSVSLAAIARVDAEAVYLNVTKEDVLVHGWEAVPAADRHAGVTADEPGDTTGTTDEESSVLL